VLLAVRASETERGSEILRLAASVESRRGSGRTLTRGNSRRSLSKQTPTVGSSLVCPSSCFSQA